METTFEQIKNNCEDVIKITLPASAAVLDPWWYELIQSPLVKVEYSMPVIEV